MSGTLSSNSRRPSGVATAWTVRVRASTTPARKSDRTVSMPPTTLIAPPSCSRRPRTYSTGSPSIGVLFHGSSPDNVLETTCLRTGLRNAPNGSSVPGQNADHSCQSLRPMTTSVTGLIASVISAPSSGPNASNWNRFGFSTTPFTEQNRCAVVVRVMVISWLIPARRGAAHLLRRSPRPGSSPEGIPEA